MAQQIRLWLRETGRLTLGYLGVGSCFVVAGLLYFGIQKVGVKAPASMILSLTIGFVLSYFFWQQFERTILLNMFSGASWTPAPQIIETTSSIFVPDAGPCEETALLRLATTVAVATLCFSSTGNLLQLTIESPMHSTTRAPEVVTIDAYLR